MANNFEQFLKKQKLQVEAIQQGESNVLLKEEIKQVYQEKELQQYLSKNNYVEKFGLFLKDIEKHYIGKLLSFNYENCNIIVNDKLMIQNNGLPRSSFLIATLKDFEKLEGIEHFLLLTVNDIGKLEDHIETQLALVKQYKQLQLEDIDIHSNDRLKREHKALEVNDTDYMSFNCNVVGMFYRVDENHFAFSSQVNLVLSPSKYVIAKPDRSLKELIANHEIINKACQSSNGSVFKGFEIGTLSETESSLFVDEASNPSVYIDLNTFRGKRTGFFAKTRLGKSNNAKIILSEFIKDNAKKTNTNIHDKTGILVFDENGEYANINNQDNTSIYEKYKDVNNGELIKIYTINKNKKDNLLLNFYLSPSETMELFAYLLSGQKSIYIESFLNTDLPNLSYLERKLEKENESIKLDDRLKVKLQLFWALLYKAGYKYNDMFFTKIGKLIENPFQLSNPIRNNLDYIYDKNQENISEEYLDYQSYQDLNIKSGDNDEAKFHKMCTLIDLFVEIYIQKPDIFNDKQEKNKKKFIQIETLLEMFNTTNKAGYKMLRRFKDFHSENTKSIIDNLIDDVCDKAIVAIIDLSSTTNSEVKKYYTQRITKGIYNRMVLNFTRNKLNEKPMVLGYYEEAHNLFPTNSDPNNIYYKIAKEGGKYNFGMIYVTQSPSGILSELLVQTENFFIGHLSAPSEISTLNSLNYAYRHLSKDILTIRKIGFMRMLTDDNRYPIPVQIKKFE